MRMIPANAPIAETALRRELSKVPYRRVADGSGEARGPNAVTEWIWGLSQARLYGPGYPNKLGDQYPILTGLIEKLMTEVDNSGLFQVMVNKLEGGGVLKAHRDAPHHIRETTGLKTFYCPRFHLPIETNRSSVWWDEDNGEVHMGTGYWHGPVNYIDRLHSMANYGPSERVHVVVDLVPWWGEGLQPSAIEMLDKHGF